jgi:hypothetical protein
VNSICATSREFETAARAFNNRDQILIISDREIRLWEDGEIKTFDPAEGFLSAEDINARGQIVGQSGVEGFVFELRNAKFTTFALPGATETSPQLINANGVIFGESELGFFLAFPKKEKRKK